MYFKSQSLDLTLGRGVPSSFLNEHRPNPLFTSHMFRIGDFIEVTENLLMLSICMCHQFRTARLMSREDAHMK